MNISSIKLKIFGVWACGIKSMFMSDIYYWGSSKVEMFLAVHVYNFLKLEGSSTV